MPLASPMAETFSELNQFCLRRAWGMTAKDSALPDMAQGGKSVLARAKRTGQVRKLGETFRGNRFSDCADGGGFTVPIRKAALVWPMAILRRRSLNETKRQLITAEVELGREKV